MNIQIITIGKKHDEYLREAIGDYSDRLSHVAKLEWKIVDGTIADDELLKKIQPTDVVVVLHDSGRMWSTEDLSLFLEKQKSESTKKLIFVIGGSYGISEGVMKRANYTWSLSKLIFPHMLVRLILAEQLYRAFSILEGSKYHHG
jgi:23S rRNA (pseudouridine1915-N3)-methyltransferase